MDSLDPKCTPMKQKYDGCFNRWFDKYLTQTLTYESGVSEASRKRALEKSQVEFEKECGTKWKEYHSCLNVALESRQLLPLLQAARIDNPLNDPNHLQKLTDQATRS